MRIALVASDIPGHALEFANMMASSCEVLLCIPERYRSPDQPLLTHKVEVDWLHWPRQRDPRNIIFAKHLARRIRRWNPDIVHFQNEGSVWNWLVAAFLKQTPIVTTVHDVIQHPGDTSSRRVPRIFANALIRKSDAVIVHGDKLQNLAAKVLPIDSGKIFSVPLVPPLLSSVIPKHEKSKDGRFRILFYGRIYEYKGLRYLLEAMPIVQADVPNVLLIVAGRGDDISKYEKYIVDYSHIELRNRYLSNSESIELFTSANLLALPYVQASQSGPLMTAMAFGLPVVATDVGELSSVTRSTGMGLVVPPRDPTALAAAIIKIARDDILLKQLSDNAIKAIKGTYSAKQISNKVMSIYQNLLRH